MTTSPTPHPDDFYVGYLSLPRSHRKLLSVLLPVVLGGLGFAAGAAAFSQRSPGKGVWLAQEERAWEGIVRATPYPMLEVATGDDAGMYLLVDTGKIGAQAAVAATTDRPAKVTGTLLTRDGRNMIELSNGAASIEVNAGAPPPRPWSCSPAARWTSPAKSSTPAEGRRAARARLERARDLPALVDRRRRARGARRRRPRGQRLAQADARPGRSPDQTPRRRGRGRARGRPTDRAGQQPAVLRRQGVEQR